MAFDRTNPTHLQELKDEVNVDPLSMGYAAVLDQTNQLLKLLNDPASNVGGDTTTRLFDPEALLDALDPADLESQQTNTAAAEYSSMLISSHLIGGLDMETYKVKWRGMFQSNSLTVQALDAQTTALSRAEVLWGQFTQITREDWFAARDS